VYGKITGDELQYHVNFRTIGTNNNTNFKVYGRPGNTTKTATLHIQRSAKTAQPIRTSHFYYVWSGFASVCLEKAKKGLKISKRYPEAECQGRSDNSIDKRQQQKNTKNITLKLDDIAGAPECKLY
jgi:hypothetical protein